MDNLAGVQDVDIETAEPEIHDVPQVHRAALLHRDAQQPRGAVIAAGQGMSSLTDYQIDLLEHNLRTAYSTLLLSYRPLATGNSADSFWITIMRIGQIRPFCFQIGIPIR